MRTVIFVTGNEYKFQVAQKALKKTGIKLIQKDLQIPEIQSDKVEEIASFSAQWAVNHLLTHLIKGPGKPFRAWI